MPPVQAVEALHLIPPGCSSPAGGRFLVVRVTATPEKALLDVLYLSAARSRLFARLQRLELPRRFDVRECQGWIKRIPAPYRRAMVQSRLDAILAAR